MVIVVSSCHVFKSGKEILFALISVYLCSSVVARVFSVCPIACSAVIATTLATSSAEQPRERSFAGRASPCRIGPSACAPPKRSTSLYAMLPESRSGKMSTLARPATGEPGAFEFATARHKRSIGLQFSVDGQVGRTSLENAQGLADFFDARMAGGTLRRKRQQRDARFHIEQSARIFRRGARDFGKFFGIGIRNDCAVGEKQCSRRSQIQSWPLRNHHDEEARYEPGIRRKTDRM